MKKKGVFNLALIFLMAVLPLALNAKEPEYKSWDSHDVRGLYTICSKSEADEEVEDSWNDRTIYLKKYRRLSSGVYEVEVSEKLDSKWWKIKGTDLYMYFRYNPYLHKWDEGVLEWDGYDGTFYEKP